MQYEQKGGGFYGCKNIFRKRRIVPSQHVVIMGRDPNGVFPKGGGIPSSIISRFGDREIKHVYVYENMLRIEV